MTACTVSLRPVNDIYCDNFSTCSSWRMDSGDWVTDEERARVRGWHIFHGFSETGKRLDVFLCPACVGTPRSKLPVTQLQLDGQLELEL